MVNNTMVGALRAEATLESGKFVDGARKVQSEAQKTENVVKKSFSAAGAAIKGFGGAVTAGLSIGVLAGLAKKALDYATAIKDVAAQVGTTTKELQQFQYAASQVGVKQGEIDKGLQNLNVNMGKAAAGSKTAAAAFGAVGVSLDDIKNKSKTEIFGQIADQMQKQGGAAKNAAAGQAIFGDSFSKVIPLLDVGSAGLDELSAAANRLGVVLSDSAIQDADETARKLDDVKRVLAAQIAGVVAENASSIVSLAGALGQLTTSVINFMGSNPQGALAILGAMAGSRFGLPGAAGGAIAGAMAGRGMQAEADRRKLQGNAGLLRQRFIQEAQVLKEMRAAGKPFGDQQAKVRRLRDRFVAAGGTIPTQGAGSVDLPQFLASPPKAGGRGRRGPKPPRDRSDDVAFQFAREQMQAEADVLRAMRDLATNTDDRAALSIQLLELQQREQQMELDNRVRRAERDHAEGRIDAATLEQVKVQAAELSAQYQRKAALERQALDQEVAARKARDAVELAQSAADIQIELLQNQSALARTAAEKRDVELRILAAMKEQERARLEAAVADATLSDLARAEAQQRLNNLDAIYSGRAKQVRQGTQGPLESYFSQLPQDAAELTQALEEVQVRGLQGIEQGLMDVITGAKSMKDAFKSVINSIIQDLARLMIQKYVVGALGKALGLAGGGGGLLGGAPAAAPSYERVMGFARGGSGILGGVGGTDRNILALNGLPIAKVSKGERLTVTNDNQASMAAQVEIIPSPYFDAVVDGRAARVAAPMAGQAAVMGVAGSESRMARRGRRSIP